MSRREAVITASGLEKVFVTVDGQRVHALQDITLEIERGGVVALLGPSGCGKSTLLNILAGLEAPTSGSVTVAGSAPRPDASVGVMFQKAALFPWRTVLDNVLLPAELLGLDRKRAAARAREVLTMVGLGDWGNRYPWELSGGMQQRVALARVLLPDPEIILLDEPFGALDEMSREALDLELMRLASASEKTVVLVTHSVYEAVLLADEVVIMSKGPGRIAATVQVPDPQPRDLSFTDSVAFAEAVALARKHLHAHPFVTT